MLNEFETRSSNEWDGWLIPKLKESCPSCKFGFSWGKTSRDWITEFLLCVCVCVWTITVGGCSLLHPKNSMLKMLALIISLDVSVYSKRPKMQSHFIKWIFFFLKNSRGGVPIVAHQSQTLLGSMRMQVWSLNLLSGLRIWCCCGCGIGWWLQLWFKP